MKRILIDEKLAGVAISESDSISIEKPDMCTFTGVLAKHGDEMILRLHESVKSLFDAKKQKDEEEKAQKRVKRSRKQ